MKSKQRKRLNKLRAFRREQKEFSRLLEQIFDTDWSLEPTGPVERTTMGIIPWIRKTQAEEQDRCGSL
jgi:hypothetical protein